MNFLCFATSENFLWHFLLPYRLNIDTDRPWQNEGGSTVASRHGVGRLQEKLRFRGRVTSLASFEKTREAHAFSSVFPLAQNTGNSLS